MDNLATMLAKAETGADWAEIARLEAVAAGGPFWCPKCGCEINSDETPCRMDYDTCGVTDIFGR